MYAFAGAVLHVHEIQTSHQVVAVQMLVQRNLGQNAGDVSEVQVAALSAAQMQVARDVLAATQKDDHRNHAVRL